VCAFSPCATLLAAAGSRSGRIAGRGAGRGREGGVGSRSHHHSHGGDVVRLLGVGSGCELRCLAGHRGVVTDLAFSTPDGELLASSSTDGSCRIWDVGTGQLVTSLVGSHPMPASQAAVCASWAPQLQPAGRP
jgi:WD40 repeat protein